MAFAEYKPYVAGELSDEITNKVPEIHTISLGNCSVAYTTSTNTFSFITCSDDEWSMESLGSFRIILDYIELSYGS